MMMNTATALWFNTISYAFDQLCLFILYGGKIKNCIKQRKKQLTNIDGAGFTAEQQIYNEREILPSNLQDQEIQKQRNHFTDHMEHSSDESTLLTTDTDIAGRSTHHSTTFHATDCRVAG